MENIVFLLCLATALGVVIARDIRKETTCQTHARNTGGQRALMHWDIQCDQAGHYLPLQCTKEKPKWCRCYSKEAEITAPSKNLKSCECFLAKDAAQKQHKPECEILKCDPSGKFAKKQCCGGQCHCVDPTTGQKTTQPSSNRNLTCP